MATWHYAQVGAYLRLCRWAFAETAAGRTIRLSWAGRPLDANGWRRSFLAALDRRINLKAGPPPPWRKLSDLYQTEFSRDCRAIRDHATRRLIVHQIATPELRRRFGHILSEYTS